MAGIDAYRSTLRSLTRGLWSGALDLDQFDSEMRSAMNRRLAQAWDEGAAECGLKPDEYTIEEQTTIGRAIAAEIAELPELEARIEENKKTIGGKLAPLLERVSSLWANRYNDLKNQAKLLTCKDEKLEWIYGDTEHCTTCLALNGRVKRGSTWAESGFQPQSPPNDMLECGGWNCQCRLEPTDKPISKGPLPRR